MAVTRIADLAEYVADRRRIYDEALAGDMRSLAKAHGDGPVRDAVQMLDKQQPASQWDAAGHKQAVASGIERTIAARRLSGLFGLGE
jgi:hypothetical protein